MLDPSPNVREWTFLDVQLLDSNNNIKSDLPTIQLYPEQHRYRHCDYTNTLCLEITVHLIPDHSDICQPNSCFSTCSCTSLYPATHCKHQPRTLQVHAHYGEDIESDSPVGSLFLKFEAFNAEGTAKYKIFAASYNNGNPMWNATYDFGTDVWTRFRVRLFAGHLSSSQTRPLTDLQTYDIPPYSYSDLVHLGAGDGHAIFGYKVI